MRNVALLLQSARCARRVARHASLPMAGPDASPVARRMVPAPLARPRRHGATPSISVCREKVGPFRPAVSSRGDHGKAEGPDDADHEDDCSQRLEGLSNAIHHGGEVVGRRLGAKGKDHSGGVGVGTDCRIRWLESMAPSVIAVIVAPQAMVGMVGMVGPDARCSAARGARWMCRSSGPCAQRAGTAGSSSEHTGASRP